MDMQPHACFPLSPFLADSDVVLPKLFGSSTKHREAIAEAHFDYTTKAAFHKHFRSGFRSARSLSHSEWSGPTVATGFSLSLEWPRSAMEPQ